MLLNNFSISRAKSFLNLEKVEIEGTFSKLQKVGSSYDLKRMARSWVMVLSLRIFWMKKA